MRPPAWLPVARAVGPAAPFAVALTAGEVLPCIRVDAQWVWAVRDDMVVQYPGEACGLSFQRRPGVSMTATGIRAHVAGQVHELRRCDVAPTAWVDLAEKWTRRAVLRGGWVEGIAP